VIKKLSLKIFSKSNMQDSCLQQKIDRQTKKADEKAIATVVLISN
jgi:hypothetical protein